MLGTLLSSAAYILELFLNKNLELRGGGTPDPAIAISKYRKKNIYYACENHEFSRQLQRQS